MCGEVPRWTAESRSDHMLQETESLKGEQLENRASKQPHAATTPPHANPQLQSPLFAVLPRELRDLIFEHALCQSIHHPDSTPILWTVPPPNHERKPIVDTALLLTCKLIWSETRAIPLQSSTHHMDLLAASQKDHYLFRMSELEGRQVYHLHSQFARVPDFSMHLLPHLHWKKLTWTIESRAGRDGWARNPLDPELIQAQMRDLILPNSCREVTLDLQVPNTDSVLRGNLLALTGRLRALQLMRRDGSELEVEASKCFQYTYGGVYLDTSIDEDYVSCTWQVFRTCWRAGSAEREYMHYDRWDCSRVDEVKRLPSGYPATAIWLPLGG